MIDRIRFQPHLVHLTDAATRRSFTIEGFTRSVSTADGKPGGTIVLRFCVDLYPVVRIHAIKLRDGRWWVKFVEANLPGLLHGHNGRPLADVRELALSLTRVRHIVGLVTETDQRGGIIPGTGVGNLASIILVECFRQVVDPGQTILISSHFTRLSHQQKPTGVYFGQSSKFITRLLTLSIYDKGRELTDGMTHPDGVKATRIEAIFRNEESLAKAVKALGKFTGKPGPGVATLSMETALSLVDQTLGRLAGFGWMSGEPDLSQLCKPARIIALTLGDQIHDPHRLDLALKSYIAGACPGTVTRQKVDKQLRALAASTSLRVEGRLAIDNLSDLPVAEVRWERREAEFSGRLKDIAAPDEPADDIAQAWSQTTFISRSPEPCELIGPVGFGPSPFFRDRL